MDQEHDCLPPLEHTSSGELLADAIQRLTEAIQKMFSPVSKANEAFEKLGRLALSPRCYRKAVRWDEKNRRRRLKGLPEKPYPFPMTYQCDLLLPPQPGPINVKIEWSEGGAENDQSRVVKGLEMCIADEYCNGCPYEVQCDSPGQEYAGSMMRDALELLKEQEPKLVKVDGDYVFCPSCGNELFTYPQQKFCDECGQEVKWE